MSKPDSWVVAEKVRQSASKTFVTHENAVLHIPSRDTGRTIKAHCYHSSTRPSQSGSVPVLVNFHGSGYVIPLHGSDDEFALKIKDKTSYTVLDVSYRLAPEDPFPAACNDAEDAVKYVLAHPEKYDKNHVSVSGFSAGGALALGLCGHVFSQGTFEHALAFYPPTDLSVEPTEKSTPDPTSTSIPDWLATAFNDCYVPPPIDRSHPLISPAKIEASRFPKNVLIITCSNDNLAPETEAIADRLENLPGVNLKRRRMEHCKHAWDKEYTAGSVQERAKDEAYAMAVDMLQH